MGNCCPQDNTDTKPVKNDASPSPNSKRKAKQTGEVNPFKPGARDVRIVQNEDGKLQKTVYKPPSDPDAVELKGEAQSLVTHSLMNAQKADIDARQSKPANDYQGASFQQTNLISKQMEGDILSFQPQTVIPVKKANAGMAETFGDQQNVLKGRGDSMYGNTGVEGSFNVKNQSFANAQRGQYNENNRNSINELEEENQRVSI